MEQQTQTGLQKWYEKNKLGLWKGAALYMAGYIAVTSPQLKQANDRADTCITNYTNHLKLESEAKSRFELRRLENSTTPYIIGFGDSIRHDSGMERSVPAKKGNAY